MAIETILQENIGWNILSLFISLLVVMAIVKIVGMYKTYKLYANLPGSSGRSFLFGNLREIPINGEERIAYGGRKMLECNGRYSCIWIGPFKPVISVYHPELVRKIFASSARKDRNFGSSYSLAIPWIGEGLIVANGQRWARSRRLLTPAFHFDILKNYMHVFNASTDILLEKMDKLAETGESFDICPLMTLCTLEVILKCALGYDSNMQAEGNHPYVHAVHNLTELWEQRARQPLMWSDFIYRLTNKGKHFFKLCDYVHKFAEEIIDKRKDELQSSKSNTSRRMTFLDMLLSARDEEGIPMTDLEIRNEVDTFMFAGHDTTASALPWALYAMAKHVEYQDRVQEEVDSILEGRDTSTILWQDLSKFEMLTLCIKETARLFPAVPVVVRQLICDVDLDGHTIPSGTTLAIDLLHLHCNPHVWDEPDEFRPDRFGVENKSSTNPFGYLPFSAGERNCIGQTFALNEEKVVLSRILQRYNVRLAPDAEAPKRCSSIVLKAERGIWLTIQKRKKN